MGDKKTARLNLFTELEMWMFCTTHFFRFHSFSLSSRERAEASGKNFHNSLEETTEMLQRMEYLCRRLIELEKRRSHHIEQFEELEESHVIKQHQVVSELTLFQESLHSFSVLVQEVLSAQTTVPYHAFHSIGRLMQRELSRFRAGDTFRVLQHQHFLRLFQPIVEHKILPEIVDLEFRFEVHDIFLHLFRLLCYLDYCADRLKQGRSFKSCVFVLSLLHHECGLLQRQLHLVAQYLADQRADQHRLFQMAIFGLKLEARKVFRRELASLSQQSNPHQIFVKIEDSCGLLRNSLENSFIALAQGLNPNFNKHEVFVDIYTRYEQSIGLLEQLSQLRHELSCCETLQECEPHLEKLKLMLEGFERSSLKHLMIKDWMEFRKFGADINRATSPSECQQLAHRFLVYVDTLIGEVGKRSALREVYQDDRGLIVH